MIITDKVDTEEEILASGGFADVRLGRYMGHLVAVKSLRVAEQDDLLKIKKVSTSLVIITGRLMSLIFCCSNFVERSFTGTRCLIRTC